MKRLDNRSTPTTVTFRGKTKEFTSEQDAYIWLIGEFIRYEPSLFDCSPSTLKYLCKGRRGASYFATSDKALRRPHPLLNGWYAELNLGNTQKVKNLGKMAITLKLKYDGDWKWNALNRHTKKPVDVDALLAELGIT
jgi:hypothetical protein